MYRRKIEEKLIAWKTTPNHKPLIIKGVRQCGKTSSVRQFAIDNYESVIYMDFHEEKELRTIFDGSLNTNHLIMLISASIPDAHFIPGKTCLIFDEIQDCPGARASLKFWKQDGRYDVICTGSLLGVNGYKSDMSLSVDSSRDYSIPVGSELIIDMYPMDFEEWLWANKIPSDAIEQLYECLHQEVLVPEALHNRFRQLLLEYVVVGGMPEAVSTMLTTHDLNQVIKVQQSIIQEYQADMIKYANSSDKARIKECFDSIPRQLSKENKKFQYSVVRHGGRSKEYVSCLQWIEDAGIIRRCYNTSITELPLGGNAIDNEFKVYLSDTGLFISMLDPGTQGDILLGNLFSYKGAIFENIVADILGKMGRNLYYYHKDGGVELDFLIRYKGECVPIECKAVSGNAKSLRTVMNHPEKYHVSHAIKLGDYNVGQVSGILTLPMYMAFLLQDL
ncbi:MAG: ATP-binding protein [Alistipes sp.]|nr:ATP-binding protein [Candidatus Alistipes equi]MCQ2328848.1 AAA family ATPase [Paludibacteraceae bacterium]